MVWNLLKPSERAASVCPLGYGEDARAEDFAHVGAVAEADGDDRRHHGRNLNDASEGVINVKKLDEQRYAADDFHIGRRDQVDDGIARQASEAREQPDGQRTEQGEGGDLKRDDQPVGEEFDDFQIGFRLRGAEGDECHHGNAERQCPGIEEPAIPRIGDLRALRNLNANVGSVVHKYSYNVSGSGKRRMGCVRRDVGLASCGAPGDARKQGPYQTGGRGEGSPAGIESQQDG